MAVRRQLINPKLKEKIEESLSAVLPITGIVLLISIFLVPLELGTLVMFFVGAAMLIIGMGLFQLGAEIAMTPLGEGVGAQMAKSKHVWTVALVALVIGIVITIAEPDLHVLAQQVPAIGDMVLIMTVAIGVGIFLVIAILRIIFKVSLSVLLIVFYTVMFVVSFFVPREFLAVAFDAGGVTTGPITVPFILAIGIGLAAMRGDKDAASDSFGLVALCSIGPILAVMVLGFIYDPGESHYTAAELASVVTMQDVMLEFSVGLPSYASEVLMAFLPIVAVFIIFQIVTRRFNGRQLTRVLVGLVYTYVGLVLFLCGVGIGFAPVGALLGGELATSQWQWLLIPIGMLIGYFIVKAEPAIQVLNHQVDEVTYGAVSAKMMNRCLQIGVAISVGLAMVRVVTGISIYWIVIPGYAIALILSLIVPKMFVGIAFDSGGVASGPMTSTFLLPLCIGTSEALGGNIMTDAFGVVALVAMTPLIAVQIMGLVYKYRARKLELEEPTMLSDEALELNEPDDDETIDLEDLDDSLDEYLDLEEVPES